MYDTSSPYYDLVNIFQKIIAESNLFTKFICKIIQKYLQTKVC